MAKEQRAGAPGAPAGGGNKPAPTPPAAPVTLWDKLNAAGAAKTATDRSKLLDPIVAEVKLSGDINPLLESLRDGRPSTQLGAIAAIVDPDVWGIYYQNPEWKGAVASSVSPLLGSSDAGVQLVAAATIIYMLTTGGGAQIDTESIRLVKEDVAKARASASIGSGIVLSFVEDYLPG